MNQPIMQVKNLVKHFPVMRRGVVLSKQVGTVHACDGVSFDIQRGETLGLVGESGCGKTTTAQAMLYLIEPDGGEVVFEGKNVYEKFICNNREGILEFRRKMQLVFQNPYQSLNPRWTVADIITEPFRIHRHIPKEEWRDRLYRMLNLVGLEDYHAERYPHEFSGGQRQRICIARALAVEPMFLVADEPVSSLDVSVRAQILNLLKELQRTLGLTYLYISHDLSSVKHVSHRVGVMYLGKIVELGEADEVFESPLHPYTRALMSAIPIPDPDAQRKRNFLPGEVPSPIDPPPGCRFHPRCEYASQICKEKETELHDVGRGHYVACHKTEGVLKLSNNPPTVLP
jgi:oligopeptide/dipeptide ABC transporter ATP-binding protein